MRLCIDGPYPRGVVAIHGAAVDVAGRAYVFLGPSETGKSSICRLLDGLCHVLDDDKLFLIAHGPGWSVLGAGARLLGEPMTEQEARSLRGVELAAVFRLHQAREPRLERLHPLETCRHLVDAYFDFRGHRQYNVQDKKLVFADLASVARKVPGYRFHFALSPQTRRLFEQVSGKPQFGENALEDHHGR